MRSSVIEVTSKGAGFAEALAMTERLGSENGLEKKSVLHLRLLAEELFGMIRGIAGEVEAKYWLEIKGKAFELHLKSTVDITEEMRDQFISASSSGKNYASHGFMGKIRVMIANFIFSSKEVLPYAMINTAAAYQMGAAGESSAVWSMSLCKEEIKNRKDESAELKEEWDELEKSIVANIADDVKVGILGDNVEIIVFKSF